VAEAVGNMTISEVIFGSRNGSNFSAVGSISHCYLQQQSTFYIIKIHCISKKQYFCQILSKSILIIY